MHPVEDVASFLSNRERRKTVPNTEITQEKNPTSSLPKMLPEVLPKVLSEVLHQKEGRRRLARKGEEGKRRQVAGIQKKGEKCSEEEGLGMDRAEREMVLEKGQQTASYPESNLHILSEVLTEVLPEASSSLSSYEKLIHPRLLDTNGIIEDSQRQESSSHEASPPRSFVPEVPTLRTCSSRLPRQEALLPRLSHY